MLTAGHCMTPMLRRDGVVINRPDAQYVFIGQRCTVGNPCQLSTQGVVASIKGAKYGTRTAEIVPCLAPGSVVSLTRSVYALTARGVTASSVVPQVVVASDLVDPYRPTGGSES